MAFEQQRDHINYLLPWVDITEGESFSRFEGGKSLKWCISYCVTLYNIKHKTSYEKEISLLYWWSRSHRLRHWMW